MSYLALYREFRPDSFDKVIGQEHIVRTLTNQIKTGRIGHAYLFCGARGTGKTTLAKIFARAINCLNPKEGSPCGECEVCQKLKAPTNLDILEMDAASNNKVENIRELRDKIQYPPVAGKYKVYIIDEVHMLTTEAFNALLKTLEEPPKHAVFILATTEVHKIPATILSRCLRFDFKLIKTSVIAEHIANIYNQIGKKYEKEAINLIAKAGEGSVRDALSIADICVSFSEGVLTYDDVLEVLGTSDRHKTEELIRCMFASETGNMLSVIDEMCMQGKSISILNKDVCGVLRDLLVVKTCKNANDILGLPQDKMVEFKKLAENVQVESILRAIEIFSSCEADLKYSTHPKIIFETSAVKASLPAIDYSIDGLMARVSKLEEKVKNGNISCENREISSANKEAKKVEKPAYKPVIEGLKEGNLENKKEESKDTTSPLKEKIEESVKVEKPKKPVLEVSEKATAKQPEKVVENISEEDEDLASLMASYAPVEEEQNGFYSDDMVDKNSNKSVYKPVNDSLNKNATDVQSEKKEETKTQSAPPEKKKKELSSDMDATLVWGGVLKKLRKDKEIMLWVACQDVTAQIKGNSLLIIAPGENEYSLLIRPENVQKLSDCVKESGLSGATVIRDLTESKLKAEEDEKEEKLREFFNGERFEVVDD